MNHHRSSPPGAKLFRLRLALAVLCTAIGLAGHAREAGSGVNAHDAYEAAPFHKALAMVPDSTGIHSVAQGQANDLQASITAFQSCESRRDDHQPPCELLRLNGETITTGAEIKAAVPADPHPLHLWQIDGERATVFLAGSIHMLKPSLYPLPRPYERAFQSAETLVLEVDVSALDPAELQRKTIAYAMLDNGQRLDDVLPAQLMAEATRVLDRFGLPLAQVGGMSPAMLMNQLVVLRLMTLGYHAESGMEQHFLNQLGDRQILALETIDDQFSLLFDQPMDLQIELLSDTLEQDGELEQLVTRMVRAWFAGEDDEFMEMFERQAGESELARRFTEQLLLERNIRMTDRISQFLDGSGTYFVLVGTAHLIGEDGIPALLGTQGVEARRILTDDSAGQG